LKKAEVSILDYGYGNAGAVANMFRKLGVSSDLVKTPDEVGKSKRLVIPGVGSFDSAISKLRDMRLVEPIVDFGKELKRPLLGLCLGMQLLLNSSDEGEEKGLGLIEGEVLDLRTLEIKNFLVPHMGWNEVETVQEHPFFLNAPKNSRYYFVHTYYCSPKNSNSIIAQTNYGIKFPSVIGSQNIVGAQFHPEKSHIFGMHFLNNFVKNSQC
jgi:glutamine amidotransferase